MISAAAMLIAISTYFSGFRQENFLETTIKGRSVVIPVMSNNFCIAHNWPGFVNDIPLASAWLREKDGSNTALVLSRYSGSIRSFSTNQKVFFDLFSGSHSINGARSFKIDEDHNLFAYVPGTDNSAIEWWKAEYSIHADIDKSTFVPRVLRYAKASTSFQQRYVYRGAVSGYGILSDWEGGRKHKRLFTVTPHGRLNLIDISEDPKALNPVIMNIPIGNGIVSGVYTDGKISTDGKYELLLWGNFENGAPLAYCSFNPYANTVDIKFISPVMAGDVEWTSSDKIPTVSTIAEALQFWVSDEDWRIVVRYRNGNFLSLDRDGKIIETPIITSVNGGFRNIKPLAIGTVGSISTCNSRKNWKYCSELLLFENFSTGNDGVRRMEWIPDGYKYSLPIEVWMKDASQENNISKPQIILKNRSSWKEASNITIRIWHSRAEETSQTIAADLYYSYIPGAKLKSGVFEANGNITYTDIELPNEFILGPGDSTQPDGIQLGIHFNNYYPGVWDRKNDWSWVSSVSSEYRLNNNVTVYTRGNDGGLNKVFGIDPPENFVRRPVVVNSSMVFGMDDISSWEYPFAISLSEQHTQGNWGIKTPVSGYQLLVSRPFILPRNDWTRASIDVLVDESQPNPYWVGDLSLIINIPSLGVQNAHLGTASLTALKRGVFESCNFTIPEWLRFKLILGASDAKITIAVNGNTISSPLILDNFVMW